MSAVVVSFPQLPKKVSDRPQRIAQVEHSRVIHRILRIDLASEAGTTRQWYRRVVLDPSLASEALVDLLEEALARLLHGSQARKATAHVLPLLPAVVATCFLQTCAFYGLDAAEARALLQGEERTNNPTWRRASHARQAALYLANQALGVPQQQLAQLIGKSAASVSMALRSVEDRRDDPAFDQFIDRAQQILLGAFS